LQGTIPANFVTIRGVEYYVSLSDGQTVVTFPAINPVNQPAILTVQIDRLAYPLALAPKAHRMVSTPVALEKSDIDSVLSDDYGAYDFLPRRWRIFRWQNGAYAEHPGINAEFTPGAAFWLIALTGEPFDVDSALSVNSAQAFTVTLQPGFNQIGNPFAFPVAWAEVGGSAQVQAPVKWNGEDYEYNQTILQPFEGYFVFNSAATNVTLSVPPRESQNPSSKVAAPAQLSEKEFILQIKARGLHSGWKDQQNFVGMLDAATNESDRLDFLEAPPFGDHLRLSIVAEGNAYAGNFHAIAANGSFWDLQISTTGRKETVHLAFADHEKLPANFQIWLLDKDRQSSLSVHNGEAEVEAPEKGKSKSLRLIVGTPAFANQANDGIALVPHQFALKQNYPNPFWSAATSRFVADAAPRGAGNLGTIIEYELAERSEVRLEIYNILGQRVQTLVNAVQAAGVYQVNWAGADHGGQLVSSGVYLCRLKAGEFVAVRKLVLSR
jgi:hypothetical protein